MSYRPQPSIYVRAATGGRDAVRRQEERIRAALAAAEVPHEGFHVYSDVDTPGLHVGASLAMLVAEARAGNVGVVVLEGLHRLSRQMEVLHEVLLALEEAGASTLLTGEVAGDPEAARRLRDLGQRRARPPVLDLIGDLLRHREALGVRSRRIR
jgi:DNA invertase Pin-like site-specific DNA recombinase